LPFGSAGKEEGKKGKGKERCCSIPMRPYWGPRELRVSDTVERNRRSQGFARGKTVYKPLPFVKEGKRGGKGGEIRRRRGTFRKAWYRSLLEEFDSDRKKT